MKYLPFILLILSSCITQRKCYEKFPPDTVTVTHDTTIFRDTIVYRTIKGDTVYKEVKLPYSVPIERTYQPITLKTSLAISKAWVAGNRLKMLLVQKDSILQFKLDSVKRASQHTEIITKIVEKPLPQKPFYRIGFFILAGMIILLIFALKR